MKINIIILSTFLCKMLIGQDMDPYNQIINHFNENNFEDVITLSQSYIKNYPHSENIKKVKLYLGISYLKLNDTDNAIKTFQEHNTQYPTFEKNEQVRYLIGKLYYDKNDYAESKKVLNEMLKKYPSGDYSVKGKELLTQIKLEEDLKKSTPTQVSKKQNIKKTELSDKSKYSITKLTWTKAASASCLIASPILFVLGNNYQKDADNIYNNNYKNATTSVDATKYYNQVDENSVKAANYKTMSLVALSTGVGFFVVDYFFTGRIKVAGTDKQVSLNYQF